MRIQFHIYFSKRAKRRFYKFAADLCTYVIPAIAVGLHLAEILALLVLFFSVCCMESQNLRPVMTLFCTSAAVYAVARGCRYLLCRSFDLPQADALTYMGISFSRFLDSFSLDTYLRRYRAEWNRNMTSGTKEIRRRREEVLIDYDQMRMIRRPKHHA